jgi:hypothetical protein
MRSTIVSPSATRPAMTRLADARRSVAITVAPDSCGTPSTTATLPSTWMVAPSRTSSFTCMKRFSKMVSVTAAVPCATHVQRHELRLHVGREAGVFGGAEALRLQRGTAALEAMRTPPSTGRDVAAGVAQLVDHGVEVVGAGMAQEDLAARCGHGAQEGAGLDAIRHHGMLAAVQFLDALDADMAGAVACRSSRPS